MPYVPVDVKSIRFDDPQYDTEEKKSRAIIDLYGQEEAVNNQKFAPVDVKSIKFDQPELAKSEGGVKTPQSFLQEMGANADNAIQAAKDLANLNFQAIGQNKPTPKTEALADKLFKGIDNPSISGMASAVFNNIGGTSPSDYSGALLEKFNETPAGKAAAVIGGLNPVYNAASTALNRYVNPTISEATGIHPDNLALGEMLAGSVGLKGASKIKDPTISAIKYASNKMGEGSGVSVNAALVGTPDYIATRKAGMFADKGQALEDVSTRLHSEATPFYDAVDSAGGRINPQGISTIRTAIDAAIGPEDELLSGPTINLYDKMKKSMEVGDISITKLDRYRRKFSAIANDTRKSVVDGGGLTEEGRLAVQAVRGIDKALSDMQPNHFSSGSPEIVATLEQARAASSRAQAFDRIKRIAQKTEGDPARTKAALTKFVNDKNKLTGLKDEEIAALQTASERSPMEYLERGLGTFGLDLGVRKNVALPGLTAGSAALGAPGVIPVVAGGTVARQLSKYAARGKLQKAMNTIESRPINRREIISPPEPKRLTYQPEEKTVVVNTYGQAIPLSKTDRDIIGQSPKMKSVMQLASPTMRAEFAQAWDKLNTAQQTKISTEIEKAWRTQKTPLAQMIKQAKRAVDEVKSVTGADIKNPVLRDALMNAIEPMQTTLKEIMQMKPTKARAALAKYKASR